jgi:rhomboid protease GluP
MAWGISPRKVTIIPLGDYNADHYLTLLFHAFESLGWHTGYFGHDGIIAYTNISWESYAEEVSVRIINNRAVIKSECVGYQFFFTDYGKNEKNLALLSDEITYVEFHLQHNLEETTQELMDSVPENQFINLDEPPMGYKEKLRTFISAFILQKNYFITPLLVLVNIAVFIVTRMIMAIMLVVLLGNRHHHPVTNNLIESIQNIYLTVGFSSRTQVLNGQVWRLFTNTFLHFSWVHLAGNMIILIYIGSMIESKLGKWNYLLLYLFAGICASITSVVWHDHGVSGGASGAIFGLFGILLALLSTDFYESNVRKALLISTAIFVGYNIIPIGRQIDNTAHLGGLISGYVLGWIAYLGLKRQKQKLITVCSFAVTVLYTGLCIAFAPVYDLKEYSELSQKTGYLTVELTRDFYGHYDLDRNGRMAVFTHKTLPEIDTLNHIAKRMGQLSLPKKRKRWP